MQVDEVLEIHTGSSVHNGGPNLDTHYGPILKEGCRFIGFSVDIIYITPYCMQFYQQSKKVPYPDFYGPCFPSTVLFQQHFLWRTRIYMAAMTTERSSWCTTWIKWNNTEVDSNSLKHMKDWQRLDMWSIKAGSVSVHQRNLCNTLPLSTTTIHLIFSKEQKKKRNYRNYKELQNDGGGAQKDSCSCPPAHLLPACMTDENIHLCILFNLSTKDILLLWYVFLWMTQC